MTTYFPEMLSVPDGTCLNLLWQEQDSLEGPNPGALLDALCRTDAVGQARHGAGAQAHFPGQVPEPLGDLWRRGSRGRAAGAHQPAQGVQGPVHGALAVAVVSTHVTSWGTERGKRCQHGHHPHHCHGHITPWQHSQSSDAPCPRVCCLGWLPRPHQSSTQEIPKAEQKSCRQFASLVYSRTCQDSFTLTVFLKMNF